MKKILAFETSCDDTAVAIVDASGQTLGEAIFSQLKEHAPYGGVVPEIGSRSHIEQIWHVTRQAFLDASLEPKDIDVVAATFAPGLLGPLLVGAQFAKGFSLARSLPLIAVHHIEGHIFSGLGDEGFPEPPFLALIASGGHTALYSCEKDYQIKVVGETLDDAAGEAFDKIGRALGLGYPAGKIMDDLALTGDKKRFPFPIALRGAEGYDFSFSGLKTKGLNTLQKQTLDNQGLADFCASFREAIAMALAEKAIKAIVELKMPALVLGGGVAANSRVRELIAEKLPTNIKLYLPPKKYCTDNASMIAKAAIIRLRQGLTSAYSLDALANLPIEQASILTGNKI